MMGAPFFTMETPKPLRYPDAIPGGEIRGGVPKQFYLIEVEHFLKKQFKFFGSDQVLF